MALAIGMIAATVLPSLIGGGISLIQQHQHNKKAAKMAEENKKDKARMMAMMQQSIQQTNGMVASATGGYIGPQGGGFGRAGQGAFPPMMA